MAAQNKIKTLEEQFIHLDKKCRQLIIQENELKINQDNQKREMKIVTEQLRHREDQVKDLSEQKLTNSKEIKELQNKLAKLLDIKYELDKERSRSRKEANENKLKIDNKLLEIEKLNKTITDLRGELETVGINIQREADKYELAIKTNEGKVEQAKLEQNSIINNITSMNKTERVKLQEEIDKLMDTKFQNEGLIRKLKQSLEVGKKDLEEGTGQINQKCKELELENKKYSDLINEKNGVIVRLEGSISEKDIRIGALNGVEKMFEIEKEEKAKIVTEVEKIRERCTVLESLENENKERYENLDAKYENMFQENKIREVEMIELEKEKANIEMNKNSSERLNQLVSEKSELQLNNKNLIDNLSTISNELESLKSTYDSTMSKYQEQEKSFKLELSKLGDEKHLEVEEFGKRAKSWEEKLSKMEVEFTSKGNEIKGLLEEKNKLEEIIKNRSKELEINEKSLIETNQKLETITKYFSMEDIAKLQGTSCIWYIFIIYRYNWNFTICPI